MSAEDDLSDQEENDEEEDEDDDIAEEENRMLHIRTILTQNNETLLSHLAQNSKKCNKRQNNTNKKLQKQIEGLRDKQFTLNDRIDIMKTDETIQCLTDRIDQNAQRIDENTQNNKNLEDAFTKSIEDNKQSHKKLEKKYTKMRKEMKEINTKIRKEMKEIKNKLFNPEIPSDNKPHDFESVSFWMTRYGKFSDELKKKFIHKNITSFDVLRNVSFDYLCKLDTPLHEIPNIAAKIKNITSGDIAKCTQEYLQYKSERDGVILRPNVSGFKPRFECIQTNNDPIPLSKGVEKLYRETMKANIDLTGDNDIRVDFDELKDVRMYKDVITDFITMNKIGNVTPDKIRMGVRNDLPPSAGTRKKTHEQDVYYNFEKLSDLIAVKKCKKSHTKHLKSKKGVFAKKNIAQNTVLGEYIGVVYLEKEFEDIFQNSMMKSNHERYTIKMKKQLYVPLKFLKEIFGGNHIDEDIDVNMSEDNEGNHNNNHNKRKHDEMNEEKENDEKEEEDDGVYKKRKLNDSAKTIIKTESEKRYKKTFILIVDPLRLKQLKSVHSLLCEINDCRKHLYMETLTNEDEERRNIKCITCYVNHWPTKFIIADKEIKANTELLSFCGRGYEDNMYAQRRDAQMKSRLI